MADRPKDPPPEFIVEFTARELAHESMFRMLFDAMCAMLNEDVREQARTAAINRAIKMIELVPLEDMKPEMAAVAKSKACEKVRDVLGRTVRRNN